jgi:hypothetical protein
MMNTSHNKDILVPEEMAKEFPHLNELLNNPELEKEFQLRERSANLYKNLFHALGLSALISIVVVLLITTWRLFLNLNGFNVPPGLFKDVGISWSLFFCFGPCLTFHFGRPGAMA